MEEFIQALEEANVGKVWLNEPLKYHTTWKIGGPADLMVQPDDKEALIRCMRLVFAHDVPFFLLGRGSNLLVRDGGIRGIVIKLGEGLDDLHVDGNLVTVGAGYSMIKLAIVIAKQNLAGLEFAGGIPGTVGGAVYMNAGAHGSEVSRVLQSAEMMFDDGKLETLSKEELKFSYRTSILQWERKGVCLQATFQLDKGDPQQIKDELANHKEYRRNTQPLQQPCCGSVFRNPKPHSAGRLIEESGLKGYRVGDAQVSTLHANFIVNKGQATAQDVLTLIQHIKHSIAETFDVRMHTEVQVVGEE
jgi:UDP-N-acetylmuramate dehydrogenase